MKSLTDILSRAMPVVLAVLLLSVPASSNAADAQQTEYRIKSAFLYNFSRFVTWPEAALAGRSEFSVCVLGSDPFGQLLDELTGKTVHDRALVVKRIHSETVAASCHLVYIGQVENLKETLRALRGQSILTVSDTGGFTTSGGMIQFKLVDNKVRFKINVEAANAAGLTISSKLLSLAISVTGNQ
jgi:hypothetical protein